MFQPVRLSLILSALAAPIMAAEAPPDGSGKEGLKEALTSGTTSLFLRSRYEKVDQDAPGVTKNAEAFTTRAALGYETRPWNGLSVMGQFEGVFANFGEHYNSSVNGKIEYPLVSDPEGAELNQAWVKYVPRAVPKTALKAGRQEISLDNQRFIGPVGWRQNWQSFDAVTATCGCVEQLTLFYGYLDQVHRVVGEDSLVGALEFQDSHLFNANYAVPRVGSATVYAYLIDFDESLAAPAAPLIRQSTQTYGARLAGPYQLDQDWSVLYAAEYAQQEEYGGHTDVAVDAHYALGEIGASWRKIALKGGYELLSGSGDAGDKFSTPLATLHAFNGWADVFTTTPDIGLKDHYAALTGDLPITIPWLDSFRAGLVYHRFDSDTDSVHFGDELDLLLEYAVKNFDPRLVLGLKFADYRADQGDGDLLQGTTLRNVDTRKTWAYAQYSF